MNMIGDDNEDEFVQNFKELRAKFEHHINASKSSPGELGNTIKLKRSFEHSNNHELTNGFVDERDQNTKALKKCPSEVSRGSSQFKPPIPQKPHFLKKTSNGRNTSNIHEIIERLNNANIPLAGSLMPNRDDDGSTNELSEISDEHPHKSNRSNSFMEYGAFPRQIIEEMKAGGHFKKIPSVRSKLPEGVGHVRPQRTRRMFNQMPTKSENFDSWCSSAPVSIFIKEASSDGSSLNFECKSKPVSVVGSSSTSSEDTMFETYEYFGQDAEENRRCSELHGVVYEMCCKQRTFLRLLTNMCRELVPFIKKIDEKSNHKAFVQSSHGHGVHVLEKLSKQLEPILLVHEVLFENFSSKFSTWSALTPDFAEIFNKHADFLKICSGFLLAKNDLTDELVSTMEQNKYLTKAIRLFEEEVLNAPEGGGGQSSTSSSMTSIPHGGISLIMHLDSIHQNVVRYILLMERYRKLLPDGIGECEVADEAINKLKAVSQAINCSLMGPDYTNKLMELHRKVQGTFDVFSPSRRLIHEGRLMKQSRKELQERHLVLFSDWILLGRYTYPFDYFDPTRMYKIPLGDFQIIADEHVDHECEFSLISPNKSTTLVARSKKERDMWVNIIEDTRDKWLESERILQEQRRKKNIAPIGVFKKVEHDENKTPTDPNIIFLGEPVVVGDNADAKTPVQHGPLWVPDDKATECMMLECKMKFNKIKRRHHCRNCGYLICRNCSGKAPVKVKNFECVKVCSECYDRILDDFTQLFHFPLNMVKVIEPELARILNVRTQDEPATKYPEEVAKMRPGLVELLRKDPFGDTVLIKYDKSTRFLHPRDLFKEPPNKHYHRIPRDTTNISRDSHETTLLISGKVHLIQKKGTQVRWAKLDTDFYLNFYEAELDVTPIYNFFIYGYSVFINDRSKSYNGTEFILLHQNQIKTERKDLQIKFRVENDTAADEWKRILTMTLGLPLLDRKEYQNN